MTLDDSTPAQESSSQQRTASTSTKLRYACNNCHAAKVRCSGEKTGCRRCQAMNEACVFSVSMVGKVVGARGKYNQSKQQQLNSQRRKNEQQQKDQQQPQQQKQHDVQQSIEQCNQSEPNRDSPLHESDTQERPPQQQPQSKKQKTWTQNERISISPPASQSHGLFQPMQDVEMTSHTSQNLPFVSSSRQDTPSLLGIESPGHSVDLNRNLSPIESGPGGWTPTDLSNHADVFRGLGQDFTDLMSYDIRDSMDASRPIRNQDPMPGACPLSLDNHMVSVSNLLGGENVNFCLPQDSLVTPPLSSTNNTPLQPPITQPLDARQAMPTSTGLVPRTESRPAGRPEQRSIDLTPRRRGRVQSDSESEASLASTSSSRRHEDPTRVDLRKKCIASSASILSNLEACLEGLRIDVTAKECGVDPPTLDSIMELNRRTSENVDRIMRYNGKVESYICIRILIMVMEMITQILQKACVEPFPAGSSSLNPTFGSYQISKSDQEWLRRRLLRTEVQKTFNLVKALRSSCAVGKFYSHMNPLAHDNGLQALLRTLNEMLDDLGGQEH